MAEAPVVFEDQRLIAVCKPAGQAVIPGRGLLSEPLSVEVGRRLGGKAFVVHRLDYDASGLVVFAKDAATHRALSLLFENRRMQKLYLALVQGEVRADGVADRPLRVFGSGRSGVCEVGAGKPSVTHYRLRSRGPGVSLLEVAPETGRRHQIRVHLNSLDHPILGDRLYGVNRPVGGVERLMLHAWRLDFDLADKEYRLGAPPGEDFLRVLNRHSCYL